MATPLSPSAAGTIHPVSSPVPITLSQPVMNGRTVDKTDVEVQIAPSDFENQDSAGQVGYLQRMRRCLSGLSESSPLSQIRRKLFGSGNSCAGQPSSQAEVVTIYHCPTLWEHSVSAVGKLARLVVAPARLLVWKPLKFFCVKVSDAKTYLFNYEKYAAAKAADFEVKFREELDYARHMNSKSLDAKARVQVAKENLEAQTRDRIPYVRALNELKPILNQRRMMVEANQPRPDEVKIFRELGVLPNDKNAEFVNAMTEYNNRKAECRAAELAYNAAAALTDKKGKQPPTKPAILDEKLFQPRIKCGDKEGDAIREAYQITNLKPLRERGDQLTRELERLQMQLRETVPDDEDCSEIGSKEHLTKLQNEIIACQSLIDANETAMHQGAPVSKEEQLNITSLKAVIPYKQLLVQIYHAKAKLSHINRQMADIRASREIDVQEWKNGAFDEKTCEMLQGKRDRLSLDQFKRDEANLKFDRHGNIIHLAYLIDRPLINPVHQEFESREARNNGHVWRRARADYRPEARYEATTDVVNGETVVTGSQPAVLERRHWYVRNEPVLHVREYDKHKLAVTMTPSS